MRFSGFIAILWLALTGAVAAGHAENRVALVIGNDRYASLPDYEQLQKAVNDARAVGAALRQIGFTVISGENVNRSTLVDRFDELTQRLSAGDTAFFFFSGHGVALDGVNYILPTDVPNVAPGQETRLKGAALAEPYIVSELSARGVRVAVVVLDACRTNPFARSGSRGIGGDRGLSPPPQVRGVFSLYAASTGQAARDRLSDDDRNPNSVFTRVLVPELTKRGLDLTDLAFEVREEVARIARQAGYDQRPAYYDETIGGRIYLAGLPPPNAVPAPPPAPGRAPDEAAWEMLKDGGSADQIRRFISEYPDSPWRRDAEARLKALEQRDLAAAPPPPAGPPSAGAATVVKRVPIGAATVALAAPDGFCQMTDQDPSDARAIKILTDTLGKIQNELLAMLADCRQLKAWRVGIQPSLDDYVQYQTPIQTKDSNFPRAESVKQICATMRAQADKIFAGDVTADIKTRLENAMSGAKFNEPSFLGVLAEDSGGCYYGLLQKLRTETGIEKTQVTIAATTIVRGKIIYYNFYTVYKGTDSVIAAVARQRRNVMALLAANGG